MFTHLTERNVKLTYWYKKKSKPVSVTLTKAYIKFESSIKTNYGILEQIPWCFILSCNAEVSKSPPSLYIEFYQTIKEKFQYNKKIILQFTIDSDKIQEAEFYDAKNLANAINAHIHDCQSNSNPYLVLVNPFSGSKKSESILKQFVIPIFDEKQINYEIMVTENAQYTFNFIKSSEDLLRYKGIILVSGDGLIFEAINGMFQRNDCNELLAKLPIGVIAAGSGNGLAATISYFSGIYPSDHTVLFNILLLTNPFINTMDLMKFQTFDKKISASFLSITWGILANIDVGSDKYRWMGHSRFEFSALLQIAKSTRYRGKLWYLPYTESSNEKYMDTENNTTIPIQNNKFKYLDFIDISLDQKSNWVYRDDYFSGIIATSVPFIATDACIMPVAKLNDGIIHLIIFQANIPRITMATILSQIKEGTHINSQYLEIIQCSAFRLIPENNRGLMAVDGEPLPIGGIQAEILPSAAKIFTSFQF